MRWSQGLTGAIATVVLISIGFPPSARAAKSEDIDRLRATNRCPGCNLQGADLGQLQLQGANLFEANLQGRI